jgi:hypothetical protein
MNKIAIGIHFDSLGEAYNFPENFQDPSFFKIMDRFLEFSSRRKFQYTIYVIGKDLENEANAAQVRKWAAMGHEIGSHSWSHHVDLSLLTKEEVYEQVYKAHEIITRTTGVEPKGFVAPGWAYSDDVYNSLISLNYKYDTSVFSSWVMIPQYFFWIVNFIGSPKFKRFFRRGADVMKSVFAPKDPFVYHEANGNGNLYVLPIPITKARIACWHSLGFVLGWKIHFKLLRQSLKESKAFYYTMHAGDMIAPSDLNNETFSRRMPRSKVSIEEKKQMFERVLDIFEENGMEIVTCHELAKDTFSRQEYEIQI